MTVQGESAPDTIVVVQARMGSTRLPGKVLSDLGGRPMLALQLARLGRLTARSVGRLVVATTSEHRDDPVAALADELGVAVIRGEEADVLGRYLLALDSLPSADTVVRLTADCPLSDPELVAEVVELHRASGADYTSNVHPRSYPTGLDVEVMSASALRIAAAEAVDPAEREHVTPFIVRRPERFRLATLWSGQGLEREWWTVDRPEDLDHLRSIVSRVANPVRAHWAEILATVGRQFAAEPGAVILHPLPPPNPGSSPWVKSWTAERDQQVIGTATAAITDGVATVDLDAPTGADAGTRDALDAAVRKALAADIQVHTILMAPPG